jgi:N-acetylglutamate synthase-like GNAT family acetyltransferase
MNVSFESRIPAGEDFWKLFSTTGWNDEYHLSAEELHAAISDSWRVLSVFEGDRLIGFGRVVSDGVLHAMIYDLIVDPDYRERGIGTEILDRLVAACRAAGIRDVQIFAAKGRRGFYERRGFRARADDSPGMDYSKWEGDNPACGPRSMIQGGEDNELEKGVRNQHAGARDSRHDHGELPG